MSGPEAEEEFRVNRMALTAALRRCFDETPEWHGKMIRPKADGPFRNHIPMSFSMTLIDFAGGMKNLRDHWEVEP